MMMKPFIRKTAMRTLSPSWLAMCAALFASSGFFVASSAQAYPQAREDFDGVFNAISLDAQDRQPSLDGAVISKPVKKKKPGTSARNSQTVADVTGARVMLASNFVNAVARQELDKPGPVSVMADTDPASGILIAVEKKDHAGKLQRKEAIVTVEDIDDAPGPVTSTSSTPAVQKSGISVTLGGDHDVVRVLSTSVGLSVQPQSIALARSGASVEILIDDLAAGNSANLVQVYPRDAAMLHWDATTRTLTATGNHARTELFVTRSGQLVVVPVIIGSPGSSLQVASAGRNGLALPPELVRLPSGARNDSHVSAKIAGSSEETEIPAHVAGTSINATREEAEVSAAEYSTREVRLRRGTTKVGRRSLRVNLTDDRASIAGAGTFPVAGAQVYVAGAEFSSVADARGSVNLLDIPAGARLTVVTNDNTGNYVRTAAMVEVPVRGGGPLARDMIVPRVAAFDAWMRMAGTSQDAALGSICLEFSSSSPGAIRAQIDVKAQGPYHFNRDGFVDHAAGATSGRVCWFNVAPGPVNVSAWQGDSQMMAAEFPVLSGRHTHERVNVLPEVGGVHVQFAREPAAHEQLGGTEALTRYTLEQEQEAVLVATTQQLFSSGAGTQGVGTLATSPGGSPVVYLDANDLEPAIYRVRGPNAPGDAANNGSGGEVNVLPALPRGFVQDMAVFAQQVQDFTEGSVLVEFSALQGQGNGKIEIHLVNEYGQQVAEPWVFSDFPVTKAVFFNVPPGVYSVIVESGSTGWLAAETVSVYGEATSIVQVGSLLIPELTQRILAGK
jgi:hypothetical protein